MPDLLRKPLKYLKKYRLTHKSELQSVFAQASKASHQYFIALYSPNSLSHARLGMVITKNRLPKAVDRNRIKRIVRESFRACLATLPPLDIIVMLRGKCGDKESATVRADADKLMKLLK